MDEKGVEFGRTKKERVFCDATIKKPRSQAPTNTERALIVECISADGRLFPPFIIFKGKVIIKA